MIFLQAEAGGGWLGALLPFALMFAVFYFVLIRPQQQQQRKRKEMLDAIKVGDEVITVGGIYGKVTKTKEDELTLQIADKVEIRVTRQGVGQVKDGN